MFNVREEKVFPIWSTSYNLKITSLANNINTPPAFYTNETFYTPLLKTSVKMFFYLIFLKTG